MTKREQERNDAFLKSTNAKKNDDLMTTLIHGSFFTAGAEWADKTMLDKVCEWLRNNWRKYVYQDKDGMICFGHWENDLRKAMEL